jgi:hypothetical protein
MSIAADKNTSGEFGLVAGALIALHACLNLVGIDFYFFNAYPAIPRPPYCSDDDDLHTKLIAVARVNEKT